MTPSPDSRTLSTELTNAASDHVNKRYSYDRGYTSQQRSFALSVFVEGAAWADSKNDDPSTVEIGVDDLRALYEWTTDTTDMRQPEAQAAVRSAFAILSAHDAVYPRFAEPTGLGAAVDTIGGRVVRTDAHADAPWTLSEGSCAGSHASWEDIKDGVRKILSEGISV